MADNQTQTIMKNVILTHNELQRNLFEAVTEGMQVMFNGEYFVAMDDLGDSFQWRMVKTDKRESAQRLPGVFFHQIHKGESQMNDVRLRVTVAYIGEEAQKFIKDFNYWKQLP